MTVLVEVVDVVTVIGGNAVVVVLVTVDGGNAVVVVLVTVDGGNAVVVVLVTVDVDADEVVEVVVTVGVVVVDVHVCLLLHVLPPLGDAVHEMYDPDPVAGAQTATGVG